MSSANRSTDVSIVVPVYNGAAALAELRQRVHDTLQASRLSYELILVDDRGSADSWRAIESLAAANHEVRGIRLTRNFGQHAATICGISQARGEWIVTMDDDLEHPPEALPALLAARNEETPLVYGTFDQRTHSPFRNFSSELMRRLLKRAFPELNEHYSSFRLMHRTLARRLDSFDMHRPYIDGYLSWMTSSVATVPVAHGIRRHGTSAYTLPKLLMLAINNFVTFSQLPLRMATYTGSLLAIGSFLYMLYVVYGRITGSFTNPGYASLMSAVLFACGVQLLILGVIGEYIGRLMSAAYRRPIYIVEAESGQDP